VYPALLPLMSTLRLKVVDWTDAPADLNGLVRFAERRNLISARAPSHFKRCLPLRLSGLQFNIIFAILLLSIVVTRRSQFDLYLLSFASAGSAVNSTKISSLFLCSKWCTGCSSEKFHLHCFQSFFILFLGVQMSLPYTRGSQ